MTDGDDERDVSAESLRERLDEIESEIEAAETEADLDRIEDDIDDIETDLQTAELPEPDDEDETGPREELESSVADLRELVEESRGPYAEDVESEIEELKGTITDTEWTDDGRADLVDVVEAFVNSVEEALDANLSVSVSADEESLADALNAANEGINGVELDPDEDSETIAALLEATEELQAGVDAAEEWGDLSVREQLDAQGFYDVLDHTKDYPPEWHALKVYEKRGEVDMILLALEKFGSNFMEEHCVDALKKLGNEAAIEPMLQRAGKRDKPGIEVLGKIGSEEALDTLLDYVDTPKDPLLQKVTMKALGEIGSDEATQEIADQLVAESEEVRSQAARALGLLGDTRAIVPLADVLSDDESDKVRGSAAWALNQIGTRDARDVLHEYTDDRAFIVQSEAERAI